LGADAALIGGTGVAVVTGLCVVREDTAVKGIAGIIRTEIVILAFDGFVEAGAFIATIIGADAVVVTEGGACAISFITQIVFRTGIPIVT